MTMETTDANRDQLEHEEIRAKIAKLMAETAKLNRETVLYPLVVGSGITLAMLGIAKLFL